MTPLSATEPTPGLKKQPQLNTAPAEMPTNAQGQQREPEG
jgi:hypothetical protein